MRENYEIEQPQYTINPRGILVSQLPVDTQLGMSFSELVNSLLFIVFP